MSFAERAKKHAVSWAKRNVTVGHRRVRRVAAVPLSTIADSVRTFALYESAGSAQNRLGTVRVSASASGELELEVLD